MNTTTDTAATEHDWYGAERSYWHSKRTVAAGLVLVLVALVVAWAATGGGPDTRPTATPATYGSACALTGGDTAEPTRSPEVQWQNLDASWLPISPTQGPGRRSAPGPWSCFAQTPTGAVLAAWTIPARMGSAANFDSVVKQQTVPGAGQAAQLKLGQPAARTDGGQMVPVGFKVNAYGNDAATITLYIRDHGINGRCTTAVQWVGGPSGDWVLRLRSHGAIWMGCEKVSGDLAGLDFVSWGPNA